MRLRSPKIDFNLMATIVSMNETVSSSSGTESLDVMVKLAIIIPHNSKNSGSRSIVGRLGLGYTNISRIFQANFNTILTMNITFIAVSDGSALNFELSENDIKPRKQPPHNRIRAVPTASMEK
jgi:hypothetical protein